MKYFIFLMLLATSLAGCKKEEMPIQYLHPASNTFSFEKPEVIVNISDLLGPDDGLNSNLIAIRGIIEKEVDYVVGIYVLESETTAIKNIHYELGGALMRFLIPHSIAVGSEKETVALIHIISPENITEELQITLVALDHTPIMPGGYGKTVIKLIPAGAEQ